MALESLLNRKDVATAFGIVTIYSSIHYIFVSVVPRLKYLTVDNPLEVVQNTEVPLHLVVILLVLFGIYSYIALTSDRLIKKYKFYWILGFFIASFISLPLFWYFYIWKGTE